MLKVFVIGLLVGAEGFEPPTLCEALRPFPNRELTRNLSPMSKTTRILPSNGMLARHRRIIEQNTLKVGAKKFGSFASLDHRRLLFANYEQRGSGIFAKP